MVRCCLLCCWRCDDGRARFSIDVVSILPFEALADVSPALGQLRIVRVVRLLRLLKARSWIAVWFVVFRNGTPSNSNSVSN